MYKTFNLNNTSINIELHIPNKEEVIIATPFIGVQRNIFRTSIEYNILMCIICFGLTIEIRKDKI